MNNNKLLKFLKYLWEGSLLVICVFMLYPFYYLVINTLKTTHDVTFNLLGLPSKLYFQNYLDALEQMVNKLLGIVVLYSAGCNFSFFLHQGFIQTVP